MKTRLFVIEIDDAAPRMTSLIITAEW